MIYLIETPKDIFYSNEKIDTQYEHVEYLWRDKARYREMSDQQFKRYLIVKKGKNVWEINDD